MPTGLGLSTAVASRPDSAILPRVFVALSKLLPLFIYPLGLAIVLLWIAFFWRDPRRWLVLAAVLLLWLGSIRWVSHSLVRSLEAQYAPPAEIPAAEAIVVLGGGTRPAQYPRSMVEVNEAGDRLLQAAALYRDHKAEHVLVTGGRIDWLAPDETAAEADDMRSLMDFLGIPDEALLLEDESRNTFENAVNSAAILREWDIDEILLVTSAMHMPRSVPLFEQQGLRVIPAPTDYLISDAEWDHLWSGGFSAQLLNLLPNAENLAYTSRALKEYLGILVYGLRGWL